MKKMTNSELRGFLLTGTKTGKLATVRDDGRPHVASIWFDLDGDVLVFNTNKDSVKAKNMVRDKRVAITVDDQTPPFSFVTIEGTVSISDNPEELLHWATKIGGRYMGQNRAKEYGQRNAAEGELTVKIRPSKIRAFKDIAGW